MLDASQEVSVGLPAGVDTVVIASLVLGAVLAGTFALLRGYGRDPLERLSTWTRGRGLEYRAPGEADEIASFVGDVDGQHVEVTVRRVPGRRLVDLPPQLTTVSVGSSGHPTLVLIQPAGWVIDREGLAVATPIPTGDEGFDAKWSARGDADVVETVLTSSMRARLLEPDADGLVIEVSSSAVAIPMPGVCSDPRELERRLSIASDLARTLQ